MRKRLTAMFMAMCMVVTLLPVTTMAEGNSTLELSSLCTHHESHSLDCYTDKLVCDIVQDSGVVDVTEGNASHAHTQECYVPDCQFVCVDCAATALQSQGQTHSAPAFTNANSFTSNATLGGNLPLTFSEGFTPSDCSLSGNPPTGVCVTDIGGEYILMVEVGVSAGEYSFTITAADDTTTISQPFTLTVNSDSLDIAIDATNFPDDNFRNWILGQDYGADGMLTPTEIAGITIIKIIDKNIADLTGIVHFTALKSLDCAGNQLTSLSTLPDSITGLFCSENRLTSLGTLPAGLTDLYCYNNQLTSLGTLPTSLKRLYCQSNQITSLGELPTGLTVLYCGSNQLTSLGALPTGLRFLHCDNNQLTDLGTLPTSLVLLYCQSNLLTSLGTLPAGLGMLYCKNNYLTGLDVTEVSLTQLDCSYNSMADEAAVVGFTGSWDGEKFIFAPQNPAGYVGVAAITNLPTQMTVNTPLTLTATVVPADATNQTILWEVSPVDSGSTGAAITDGVLTATTRGELWVQATIKNGKDVDNDFIMSFAIKICEELSGRVYLDNYIPVYGDTLTAITENTQAGAVLSYKWLNRDNTVLQSGPSNTLKVTGAAIAEDVEKSQITVEVTAEGYTDKLIESTLKVFSKPVIPIVAGDITKVYDGTNKIAVPLSIAEADKVNSSDDITVTSVVATFNNANVGSGKSITVGYMHKTGAARNWYEVHAPTDVTGEITARPLANSMISGINASYPYTGSTIVPTPNVTDIIDNDDSNIITPSDYTVSYEANINAGTAKVILTGKGNYFGTAEKTFAITKATGSVSITGDPDKTYDGTAASEPVVDTNGSDGTVTFEWYEGGTKLEGAPKDAGSYSVKAMMAAGTNHTAATATKAFVIAKAAAPSITYPTAGGITYGAKLSTSALTGGSTTYGSFSWEDGNIVPTVTNSGYSVKFTPSAATLKNYEAIGSLTQNVAVTVAKATPAINLKAQVGGATSSRQATLTATLTKVNDGELPAGTVKLVNSTSGADADIAGATAVTIINGVATYTWTGLADQVYKIKAEYSGSGNYNTAAATEISFDARKQNQQNFAVVAIGAKTYGDSAFTLTTSGGNGSGAVSFVSSDPAIVSISGSTATIHKAGNVTITAAKATDNSYNEAIATASLVVNKKAISFIAGHMPNVVKGNPMPLFTYKQVALATGDSITTEPTLTTTAADTNTPGKFVINISGAVVTNADSYTITYVNGEMTIVEQLYTVTVTDGTGGGQYSEGQTVSITANDRSGYTFTSWSSTDGVTFADSAVKTTTFTMPGKNVAVKANYSQDSNGGGGVDPAPPAKPDQPVTEDTNAKTNTDRDGNVTATADEEDIIKAIEKAQKAAKENSIAITLNVKTKENAKSLEVTLSAATITALRNAKLTQFTINNSLTTITLDLAALNALADGVVKLTISKVDPKTLSAEVQKAIGNRPVLRFGAAVGGKSVTDFNGGRVGLQMPYTLTKGETAGKLVGAFVDANGKVVWLENSSYNTLTGTLYISATHFSVFGAGYRQSTPKFTDKATHWAKNDIDFVAARGLLTGTSTTTFSPNSSMTRGMFVTAIGRLAGVDSSKYQNNKFTDVKADACYAPYVAWAAEKNIVSSTSDTAFSPDMAITRQEMAVMLVNYSKAIGYKLPSVHAEVSFADSSSIASWAKDAVKQMQMAGILMGKSGNKFDPTATATRAEASAMLRRFVELVVSTETAEGWSMNESGQWMYIQDGNRTTGKKTVDGKSYEFDQYGVTTAVPPERKYLTYTVQAGDSFWGIAWKHKVSMFKLAAANGKNIFSIIHAGDELKVPQT